MIMHSNGSVRRGYYGNFSIWNELSNRDYSRLDPKVASPSKDIYS